MQWIKICQQEELVPQAGVAALVNGEQVAIFYNNGPEAQVYAIGNWDPLGKANVLSRGIMGELGGRVVVASPLYKQHYCLATGECLEEDVSVPTWQAKLSDGSVWVAPK